MAVDYMYELTTLSSYGVCLPNLHRNLDFSNDLFVSRVKNWVPNKKEKKLYLTYDVLLAE